MVKERAVKKPEAVEDVGGLRLANRKAGPLNCKGTNGKTVILGTIKERTPISSSTVVRRLNSLNGRIGGKLRKSRPTQRDEFGDYYLMSGGSGRRPQLLDHHIDLKQFAEKYEVLEPWEELADE